jgi:type VI secretion system protein VasI
VDQKKVGGVVVLLGVLGLWIIGSAVSNSHKPGASQTVQIDSTDRWRVSLGKSPMDDSKTVALSVDSDREIEGPLGSVTPTLVVRCQEGQTSIYVVTGMAATVEDSDDRHTVEIRLDNNAATHEDWKESTDHKALFAPNPFYDTSEHRHLTTIVFAKKIAAAETLTFRFTPFDGSPQVARFDVRGLDPNLHKLAETCGWAY